MSYNPDPARRDPKTWPARAVPPALSGRTRLAILAALIAAGGALAALGAS